MQWRDLVVFSSSFCSDFSREASDCGGAAALALELRFNCDVHGVPITVRGLVCSRRQQRGECGRSRGCFFHFFYFDAVG
uniref:Uncharacterized protein n=1 Tax=Physcomitrium patens TaxID=3218 RepID=A0A7I3ZVM3_PHYPA